MAAADVTGMASEAVIHPFFAQTQRMPSPDCHAPSATPYTTAPHKSTNGVEQPQEATISESAGENIHHSRICPRQSTLASFVKGAQTSEQDPPALPIGLDGTNENVDADIEEDLNVKRRKRRRLTPPESEPQQASQTNEQAHKADTPVARIATDLSCEQDRLQSSQENSLQTPVPSSLPADDKPQEPQTPPAPSEEHAHGIETPEKSQNGSKDTLHQQAGKDEPTRRTPKRKMMTLNALGTLGSPPSKQAKEDSTEKPKRTRGRPSKKTQRKELVVALKYDGAGSVGDKIEQILSGSLKLSVEAQPEQSKQPTPKKTAQKKKTPKKPTKPLHPFFNPGQAPQKNQSKSDTEPRSPAKTTQENTSVLKSPRKQSATTPGKLKTQARIARAGAAMLSFSSMLSRSGIEKSLKQPGVRDAPWPDHDWVHIQPPVKESTPYASSQIQRSKLPGARKMKHLAVQVDPSEDIMNLKLQTIRAVVDPTTIQVLRLPERLLTSGAEIQQAVRNVVRARLPLPSAVDDSGSEDELWMVRRKAPPHPALINVYESINSYLPPFDRHTCENEAWVQKYAPKLASHVISTGTAPTHLRDWLRSLVVNAVNDGTAKKQPDSSPRKPKPKKSKKRKKAAELDDFLVDSDDDDNTNDDFVELDSANSTSPRPSDLRSEVKAKDFDIMSGRKVGKLANVTLLSGPHGCGKTATVYAVAEELGFQVFEINSGARRNGKDILDRVGNMTENHLVNRNRRGSIASASEAGSVVNSESVKKEIDSGRQGTMNSFFKAVAPKDLKPSSSSKEKVVPKTSEKDETPQPTKSRREQKQSLILFEEVDVLFEEDKNFWMTVFQLAASSKRPLVLTCSNESLVPQALDLHAKLRLEPPNAETVTDYLLLLAAREGHILSRDAVSSLYEIKSYDLRASIMELDFWCQMAIGDQKGGLEWLYQRWPPGKDIDHLGRILRVASKHSYLRGMGWLDRDHVQLPGNAVPGQDDTLLSQIWRNWGVEPQETTRVHVHPDHQHYPGIQDKNSSLGAMSRYLDSMSAADIYCKFDLPGDDNPPIDSSLPPATAKMKQNFTLDPPVIRADATDDFTSRDARLFVDASAIASSAISSFQNPDDAPIESRLLDTIQSQANSPSTQLSRKDIYYAFEPIMEPPSTSTAVTNHWTFSSFDRPLSIITTDVAPYVRNIVAHELSLDEDRKKISGLLSQGSQPKRQRTTRASRVAYEGGERGTKRRENWFTKDLNRKAVMKTGGDWVGAGGLTAPKSIASSPHDE